MVEIPDAWFGGYTEDAGDLAGLEHIELDLKTKLLGIEEKLAKARGKGAAAMLHDPLAFVGTYVRFPPGGGLADYQQDIIGGFPQAGRLAVRGPRGLGKSMTASLLVLWFAVTRDAAGIDWKIMTTAGSWHQLESYLWREITKWARRVDWEKIGRPVPNERNELMKTKLRLRHGDADAASPDTPEKIEGAHADHIMLVVDEAKIVSAETFDAAEGILSGAGDEGSELEAYALAISTPGEPSGRYYDIHRKAPGLEDWTVRHVTLEEAIAAGRMSRKWADQRKLLWGENSALYQNHVLGEFCADDEDAIISLSWVEAAMERWRAWDADGRPEQDGPRVAGVDVARSGKDKSVVAVRHGDIIVSITAFPRGDLMETTGRVKTILDRDPECRAMVDVIGLGAGVYDRLKEQGMKADPFNAARKTTLKDKTGQFGFHNLRSYGWFHLADMLNPAYGPTLALPPDDELAGDLTSLHKKFMSDGRVLVEPKDDIRKRIGRSTDRGDAVMQSCYGASGSWHDAYGTATCPACSRPFLREADGKPRTECPYCHTSLDEPEGEAA